MQGFFEQMLRQKLGDVLMFHIPAPSHNGAPIAGDVEALVEVRPVRNLSWNSISDDLRVKRYDIVLLPLRPCRYRQICR